MQMSCLTNAGVQTLLSLEDIQGTDRQLMTSDNCIEACHFQLMSMLLSNWQHTSNLGINNYSRVTDRTILERYITYFDINILNVRHIISVF